PEILLDVVVQRAQRRDVDDVDAVFELPLQPEPAQMVDGPEKRGQRLARAGRRDDQRVPAGGDRVPPLARGTRCPGKRVLEPATNEGEEVGHPLDSTPQRKPIWRSSSRLKVVPESSSSERIEKC